MHLVPNTFAYLFRSSCVQSREETLKNYNSFYFLVKKYSHFGFTGSVDCENFRLTLAKSHTSLIILY